MDFPYSNEKISFDFVLSDQISYDGRPFYLGMAYCIDMQILSQDIDIILYFLGGEGG